MSDACEGLTYIDDLDDTGKQHTQDLLHEDVGFDLTSMRGYKAPPLNDRLRDKIGRWWDRVKSPYKYKSQTEILKRFKELQNKDDMEERYSLLKMIDERLNEIEDTNRPRMVALIEKYIWNEAFHRWSLTGKMVEQSKINWIKTQVGIDVDQELTDKQANELLRIFDSNDARKEIDNLLARKTTKSGGVDFSDVLLDKDSEAFKQDQSRRFFRWKNYKKEKNVNVFDRIPYDINLIPASILRQVYRDLDSWIAKDQGRTNTDQGSWWHTMKRKFKRSFMFKHTYMKQDHTGTIGTMYEEGKNLIDRVEARISKWTQTHNAVRQDIENNLVNKVRIRNANPEHKFQAIYAAVSRVMKGEYDPYIEIMGDGEVQQTIRLGTKSLDEFTKKLEETIKEYGEETIQVKFTQNEFDQSSKTFNHKDNVAYYKQRDLPSAQLQDDDNPYSTERLTTETVIFHGNNAVQFMQAVNKEREGLDKFHTEMQDELSKQLKSMEKVKQRTDKLIDENPKYAELLDDIDKMFETGDEEDFMNIGERERYFPTNYNKHMLIGMNIDIEQKLERALAILKNGYHEQYASEDFNWEGWYKNKQKNGQVEQAIGEIEETLEAFQGLVNKSIDLPYAKYKEAMDKFRLNKSRHHKFISGYYDITKGRSDASVITDYVRDVVSTTQRNAMIIKAAELMPDAPDNEMRDYIVNGILKVATNRQDLPTELMGKQISNKSVTNYINKAPLTNLSESQFRQYLQIYNNWVTSSLLWRPETAIGNMAGAVQRMTAYGLNSWNTARHEYQKNKPVWSDRVDRAGILGFRNHFIEFTGRRIRSKGKSEYASKLKKVLYSIRKQAKDGEINISEMTSKQMHALFKKISRDMFEEKAARRVTQFALENKIFGIVPGMAKTEENVRTMSYIHGVQLAKKMLGSDNITTTTKDGEDVLKKEVIQMARGLVYEQDFMLAEMDFPMSMQGNIGNFLSKLKPWQMNKFSYDIKTLKRAWFSTSKAMFERTEEMNPSSLEKGISSVAHLGRFMKELGKMIKKSNREYNPAMAEASRFLMTYGLSTVIFKTLYYTPFIPRAIRDIAERLPYTTVGSRTHSPLLGLGIDGILFGLTAMLGHNPIDPDDELDETEFLKLLRYTPLGVGPMAGVHFAFFMGDQLIGDDERQKSFYEQHGRRAAESALPAGRLWVPPVMWGAEAIGIVEE